MTRSNMMVKPGDSALYALWYGEFGSVGFKLHMKLHGKLHEVYADYLIRSVDGTFARAAQQR